MIDEFRRLIGPWQRRIALMVARGVLALVRDGESPQQLQVTVHLGDLLNGVQRLQEFGFTSTPLPGAEAIVLSIGGMRANGVVVATDDRRYRPTDVPPGGASLYDSHGTTLVLSADGTLTITAATKVRLVTPRLEVTGDIIDQCDEQARSMAGMREVYDTHTHTDPQGGTTDPPTQAM